MITTDIGLVQYGMDIGDSDVRQYVDMAKRSVERAVGVTQRLLGFSRQQSPVRKEIETNRVVGEMADLLRHSFRDSMEIRTRFASGAGAVFADPVELETAILNLAVNARDAMRQCGELTIETANASLDESYATAHAGVTAGQYVMIAISDTGVGMSHEVIARAFDPFFTTKEAGEGTGLAQVMSFVKHSNGHIEIESEQGIGTAVRLYLPRIVVTTGLADQEDTTERPTDPSAGPDVTSYPFPPSKSGPSLNSRAGGM